MEEHEAILRMKKGDLSGLRALVLMYQGKAIRIVALIVEDNQTAEDIVSDSFLKAYERIEQFDEKRPFMPWFRQIIINDALKRISRRKRLLALDGLTRGKEVKTSISGYLVSLEPNPSNAAEEAEIKAIIKSALDSLTPKQQAVVVLRYYFDLSEAEIAEVLDIPCGTVKSRAAASMRRLSALLSGLRFMPLSLFKGVTTL